MGWMLDVMRRLWTDRCTVIVRESQRNYETGVTEFIEVEKASTVPCRISYASKPIAGNDYIAAVEQTIKLIIGLDAEIPTGSKISVTRGAETKDYERSGEPARYTEHQEIPLALWHGWA